MEEALGVAYLHKAGMDNGALSRAWRICLFPLSGRGSRYAKTGDSKGHRALPDDILQQKPDDLEVRWLLNLAYMALGAYPDKVPPAYLIPPAVVRVRRRRRAFRRRGAAGRARLSSRRPAASSSTTSTATAASTS